jgi:hypothetical protein
MAVVLWWGIRQWIGYRMMEVALWWGYDSSLAIELWQLICGGGERPQNNCHNSIAKLLSYPHHKTTAIIR